MFCSNCGAKLDANARFCSSCGFQVSAAVQAQQPPPPVQTVEKAVSVPVNLKTGMMKTEPCVMLLTHSQTALIMINKDLYKRIIANGSQGGGYFSKVSGMINALKNYGESLAVQPLQSVVSQHPGSVLIDSSQIKSLKIYNGYNANNEQYDSNYTVEMHTSSGKYTGTLDKGAESHIDNAALKAIFGSRFQ